MTKKEKEIIRNLIYIMERHKNDRGDTFGTNISFMCKDILDYLEQESCGKDINVSATDCISRQPKTEVLDKIRAEVEHLIYYWYEVNPKTMIDDILQIIDKYKSESEV